MPQAEVYIRGHHDLIYGTATYQLPAGSEGVAVVDAGATLTVPAGYTGSVLRRQDTAAEAEPSWRADGHFTSVTYWNHGTHPAKMDAAQRSFEWLSLAKAV